MMRKNMRTWAFLSVSFAALALSAQACSSDEDPGTQPATGGTGAMAGSSGTGGNAAGNGGSATGGSAGEADSSVGGNAGEGGSATGGNSGEGGSSPDAGDDADASIDGSSDSGTDADAEAGPSDNGWKKGVPGKAKQVVVISKGIGGIQGLSIDRGTTPMSTQVKAGGWRSLDAGEDAEEAGTDPDVPNTIPTVNLSQVDPDFQEIWVPVPPYVKCPGGDCSDNTTHSIPPMTAIIKADGTVTGVQHFQDWYGRFTLQCFGTNPIMLNNVKVLSYGGLNEELETCNGRHFHTANGDKQVIELFADGSPPQVIVDDLPAISTLTCHPMGYLLAVTLPGYEKGVLISPPVEGVKLWKVMIDQKTKTELATLPVPADYATPQLISTCPLFPGAYARPAGLKILLDVMPDGRVLVGDAGARKFYVVDINNGNAISPLTDMSMYMSAVKTAPNGIIYALDIPVLDNSTLAILVGTKVRAFDPDTNLWTEIVELTGYSGYVSSMSWAFMAAQCPAGSASTNCVQPWGVFSKLDRGNKPQLYIMDNIKQEFNGVKLDMGTDLDASID